MSDELNYAIPSFIYVPYFWFTGKEKFIKTLNQISVVTSSEGGWTSFEKDRENE